MPISRQSRLAILGTATTGLFLAEIVVGYLTQSVALVADSFHMLSDVLSMAVAWYTIRVCIEKCEVKRRARNESAV